MSFKGTPTRSALDIARELESISASEDGYTSQEETCYYLYLPGEEIGRGMEILGDMVSHAAIDAKLFERELSVVASEMSDVEDTPSEIARDYFATAIFGDHSLGKPILGYPSTLKAICRDDVASFVKGHYVAPRIILAAVGNIDHEEFCDLTTRFFDVSGEGLPKDRIAPAPTPTGKLHLIEKKTSQLSIYLGGRAYRFDDPRRYSLAVFDTILGRGASSLLFNRLREEEGIGYRIFSFEEYFGDCGLWGIYANLDPTDFERFFGIVDSIFDDIVEGRAVNERFEETIRGLTGMAKLEGDSISQLLTRLVETELYCGRYISPEETLFKLASIRPADVIETARELLDRRKITGVYYGKSKSRTFPEWLAPVKGELA